MAKISEFRNNQICVGTYATAAKRAMLGRASIDAAGIATIFDDVTDGNGSDLVLTDGVPTTPSVGGQVKAVKVWNAVWNDVADFQQLDDRLEFGRCYFDTKSGAKICNTRCQMSVIGIASDTFGFGVGAGNPANGGKEVPIAVAGWTLAFVDQEYEPGTALTNDKEGGLTKMGCFEKMFHPERIVAIYKRRETAAEFGTEGKKIKVNGRHWVRVR